MIPIPDLFVTLGKDIVRRLSSDATQDKEIAQRQLQAVIDQRSPLCVDLWKVLWKASDELSRSGTGGDAAVTTDPSFATLNLAVDHALIDLGALVSWPCFQALLELQSRLREETPSTEHVEMFRAEKAKRVLKALVGHKESPGLLILLRDQIGSNSRSTASVVG